MGLTDKIGAGAVNAIASNPQLLDTVVNALVKALIANLPLLIEQIQQAIEKHAQPKQA